MTGKSFAVPKTKAGTKPAAGEETMARIGPAGGTRLAVSKASAAAVPPQLPKAKPKG